MRLKLKMDAEGIEPPSIALSQYKITGGDHSDR